MDLNIKIQAPLEISISGSAATTKEEKKNQKTPEDLVAESKQQPVSAQSSIPSEQ